MTAFQGLGFVWGRGSRGGADLDLRMADTAPRFGDAQRFDGAERLTVEGETTASPGRRLGRMLPGRAIPRASRGALLAAPPEADAPNPALGRIRREPAMKKNQPLGKLSLHRETLRSLASLAAGRIEEANFVGKKESFPPQCASTLECTL